MRTLVGLTGGIGSGKSEVGKYFAEYGPKYFKGPAPPRLGDLSYTELVILGP